MEPVRVAFDTGPLHGSRTGIGNAVAALREALAGRSDVQVADYLLSFRADPGAGVRRLPIPAALAHLCWARTDHPRVDRWLPPADVVHGTNYVVPPSRAQRLVSVYDCWFLRHPELASTAVQRAAAVMTRAIHQGASVVTSSHASTAALLEHFPAADVHTVYLGSLALPPENPSAAIPELAGRPYVLAIGTLERRKNLPVLVRAFGALAADQPDVQLVLAGGDGDDRAEIDAAVDRLGPELVDRVLFTGRVSEDARVWLLRNATVLAYPSLDEGFGFPLLEAMQAGVPIAASRAGSIPELVGEAGLLCDSGDVNALAANLAACLTDDATRTRLQAAGQARWPMFSWDRCADEMAALYHVIGNRR